MSLLHYYLLKDANMYQVLVPLVHALVIALPPKTPLLLDLSALVVPDPQVCSPFIDEGRKTDEIIDACTCEKAADGGINPNEVDFTTKA